MSGVDFTINVGAITHLSYFSFEGNWLTKQSAKSNFIERTYHKRYSYWINRIHIAVNVKGQYLICHISPLREFDWQNKVPSPSLSSTLTAKVILTMQTALSWYSPNSSRKTSVENEIEFGSVAHENRFQLQSIVWTLVREAPPHIFCSFLIGSSHPVFLRGLVFIRGLKLISTIAIICGK